MSWFSVLKSSSDAREIRRQARPIVNQMVEEFVSERNKITLGELEAFVKNEISNSGILQNLVLPNHNPNHRGRLIRSRHGNFVNMALYKIKEMGFRRVNERREGKRISVYIRGNKNV